MNKNSTIFPKPPRLKILADCELEYLRDNLCPNCKFYDNCEADCEALKELAYLNSWLKFLLEEKIR